MIAEKCSKTLNFGIMINFLGEAPPDASYSASQSTKSFTGRNFIMAMGSLSHVACLIGYPEEMILRSREIENW